VDPLALRVSGPDGDVRLEPRVMALLCHLAAAQGRPVTHEELVAAVWGGAFVTADAVHGAVSKLRRALERGAPPGSAIESLPRVGYRLQLRVSRGSGPAPETLRAAAGPTSALGPRRVLQNAPVIAGLGLALVAVVIVGLPRLWRSAATPRVPAIRPLTSSPGLEVEPAFAPTGDRVAFAWKGPEQEQWDLYVVAIGGGPPLRLTQDPAADRQPAWSPDAARLAFVRRGNGACSLMSVAALGGDERRLARCREPAELAYSHDGRALYFSDRAAPEAPYRVHALDLASGEVRPLLDPPDRGMGDHGLAPARFDDRLAVLRSPVLGVEDLWLVERSGAPRRLTEDQLKIHGFDWLPDGRSLVVSSNRGGLFSLWQVPAAGGELRWLGTSGGDLEAPTVSGDGRRVAFEQWQEETNLYRLDLDALGAPRAASAPASSPRLVVRSTCWDFQPALSPDGTTLAFVSDRTGSSELWTARADGGEPSQRTRFGGAYVGSPAWSPDGRALVFDVRAAGNGDLWRLPADAAEPRLLTQGPASDLAPSWSRDGHSVLFASDRSGTWQLWRLDLATRAASPVTRDGGYRGLETPGGDVVFCRADRPGLWLLPKGGSGARRLVDDLAPVDRANWTIARGVLVYVFRPVPERPTLARVHLATGRREVVGSLQDFPFTSGLALAPDASWVALARTDRREADLLWMELPAAR
jgi:Tol biopolymer transport system component/DNA-binding winged helix-turn-helix (wHTH) protein